MEDVLFWIACIFTGLFLIRIVLMFVGLDADGGAEMLGSTATPDALSAHDAADAADFKVFSFMTLFATVMFGSWIVLLFLNLGFATWQSWLLGGGLGFGAGVAGSYALFSVRKLQHDGTLREFEAKGLKGTCYVTVPEAGAGKGQVQITIKNRLFTFDAVSDGPEIPSFKPVVVMERLDEKTLRVCPTE